MQIVDGSANSESGMDFQNTTLRALGNSALEKLTGMTLIKLTVNGFKCFAEEQSFDLGNITFITGDNHVGKTSIADAIAFAFCGRLYNGTATIDRLYSDGTNAAKVTVSLIDDAGTAHELTRTRRNDKVSIIYDGYNLRQKDLDAIFGECDVFLSIMNPTYFIEYLGNDGQTLLQKYLFLPPHEEVLELMTEHQRSLLAGQSLLSAETFVGREREMLRDYKDGLIALDGQDALLHTQRQEKKKDLAMLEQRKTDISGKIAVLEQKWNEGAARETIKQEYETVLLRIDELSADNKTEENPLKSQLSQLELNLRRTQNMMEQTMEKQYESKYAGEIQKIQAELQFARDEYRKKEAAYQNVRAGIECPVCCRPITEDVLEATREGIDRSMKAMVQDGIAQNTQLSQLREMEQKAKDIFDKWKTEDIEKHRQHISELEQRQTNLQSSSPQSAVALAELLKQRQALEEAISLGGLSAEKKLELDSLKAEFTQVDSDYSAMKALCERPEVNVSKKRSELENLIRQKEDLITAALDYLSARNELTFRHLPLEKVGFSLFEILKTTGEVKNTFKFTYDGRDYRKLSHSEKIFAGMEVSEMMKKLTGRNYPVYVDDSESVVTLPKQPSGQVILSRVTAGAPLTVTVRNRQAPQQELKKAG